MFQYTKTEIAKYAVSAVISLKVKQIADHQIEEHTELDTDSIAVSVGTTVIGQLAASTAKPWTDKTVDAVIERYQSWRKDKSEDTTAEQE